MKAAAIVLLLNGVQINMPAPAIVIAGGCWVPLRPLAERLGWRLSAVDGLELVRADRRIRLGETRRINGWTYVPARWLQNIGVAVEYNPAAGAVELTSALPAPADRPVTIADIVSAPAEWAGRTVSLTGEFMGLAANPLWPALRFGPPRTTGDWVLRGDGGAIYCVGPRPFDFPAQVGRRLRVMGTVELTAAGWPFVRVASTEPLKGRDALACCILTDAYRYPVGAEIKLRLLVRNDASRPLSLTFPSGQVYDFRLSDADRQRVWQWSDGRAFTMAIVHRILKPGEQMIFAETLRPAKLPRGLRPGVYFVEGELHRNARSYRRKILIEAQ